MVATKKSKNYGKEQKKVSKSYLEKLNDAKETIIESKKNESEEWKFVNGFNHYMISSKGRLKRAGYVSESGKNINDYFPKLKQDDGGYYYSLNADFLINDSKDKPSTILKRYVKDMVGEAFHNPDKISKAEYYFIDVTLSFPEVLYASNISRVTTNDKTDVVIEQESVVGLCKKNKLGRPPKSGYAILVRDSKDDKFYRVYTEKSEMLSRENFTAYYLNLAMKVEDEEVYIGKGNHKLYVTYIVLSRNKILNYHIMLDVGKQIERFTYIGKELKDELNYLEHLEGYPNAVKAKYLKDFYFTADVKAKRYPLSMSRLYHLSRFDTDKFDSKKVIDPKYIIHKAYDYKKENTESPDIVYLVNSKGYLMMNGYDVEFTKEFSRASQFVPKRMSLVKSFLSKHDVQLRTIAYEDSIFAKNKNVPVTKIIRNTKISDERSSILSVSERTFIDKVAELIDEYHIFSSISNADMKKAELSIGDGLLNVSFREIKND